MIKDLEAKIIYLEDLLQKVTSEILANVLYEKIPPTDLWGKSEELINAMSKVAKEVRDGMLLFRPDRAPSIKRKFKAFMQPINVFVNMLKKPAEPPLSSSKQALDQLRKAVAESQDFIEMAKNIVKNPSESILEILKLREVYEAKEYISKVSIPEIIHARLEYLKKSMEILKVRVSGLEQAARDLLRQVDKVQEEISRFQRAQQENR